MLSCTLVKLEFFCSISLVPKYIRYAAPMYFIILKIYSEVCKIAPKPVIAMMPRHKSPTIFPKAINKAFYHPCSATFEIIKSTAGPGDDVATITSIKYISHSSIIIKFPLFCQRFIIPAVPFIHKQYQVS
jgi:hypothetical protein